MYDNKYYNTNQIIIENTFAHAHNSNQANDAIFVQIKLSKYLIVT